MKTELRLLAAAILLLVLTAASCRNQAVAGERREPGARNAEPSRDCCRCAAIDEAVRHLAQRFTP